MPITNARHMELGNLAAWMYHAAERKILLTLKELVDAKLAELGDIADLLKDDKGIPLSIEPLVAPEAMSYSLGVAPVMTWIGSVTKPDAGDRPDTRALKIENLLKLARIAATLSKLLPA